MSDRPLIEFFYCASCPASYLALARVKEVVSRTGARLATRPVVSAWLPGEARRGADNPEDAAARHERKELENWARFCGVVLRLPRPLAMNAEWVQRGAIVAMSLGRGRLWMEAAFEARFSLGHDLSRREAVLDLAEHCGLGVEDFTEALGAPSTGAALAENVEELVQRGGFATPTMFLGADMFVGHTSVTLLEWAVMQAAERPFIAPGEHGR